ncbi:MAG: DUF4198 domain-containing protein [Nitrospira sp.]
MTDRKTKSLRIGSLVLACVLSTWAQAQAHFMWIETSGPAAPGKEYPLTVYFGEYAEFLREEAGGRLDTLDGVVLRVMDPQRKQHDIPLTKEQNRFAGLLPSCLPGRYAVTAYQRQASVQDLTKHDMGVVKPMFYARTEFVCYADGRVGERQPSPQPELELEILPLSHGLDLAHTMLASRVGGEVVVQVLYKGQPLASRQVLVHSPIGWDKELHTDAQGIAAFSPVWAGRYVVEVEYQEKTPGQYKDRPYEAVRHRATLAVPVIDGGAR